MTCEIMSFNYKNNKWALRQNMNIVKWQISGLFLRQGNNSRDFQQRSTE